MIKKIGNQFLLLEFGSININDAKVSFKKASNFFSSKNEFIQFFSIKPVSSEQQIFHALDNALTSFNSKTKKPFTKTLSLEFLLFLTAQKQLNTALDLLELKKGKNLVGTIAFAKSKQKLAKAKTFFKNELEFKPEKNAIEKNLKKNFSFLKKTFAITDAELKTFSAPKEKALQKLVLEKIALLSLKK